MSLEGHKSNRIDSLHFDKISTINSRSDDGYQKDISANQFEEKRDLQIYRHLRVGFGMTCIHSYLLLL